MKWTALLGALKQGVRDAAVLPAVVAFIVGIVVGSLSINAAMQEAYIIAGKHACRQMESIFLVDPYAEQGENRAPLFRYEMTVLAKTGKDNVVSPKLDHLMEILLGGEARRLAYRRDVQQSSEREFYREAKAQLVGYCRGVTE